MKRINYKSDFDIILRFTDCSGNPTKLNGYDWEASFFTASKLNAYKVSCKEGELTNCAITDGEINIIFDRHGLVPGDLRGEFCIMVPDAAYPDGTRRVCLPCNSDIQLVRDAGDCCGRAGEIRITLPTTVTGSCNTSQAGIPLSNDEIDKLIESINVPVSNETE